MASSQHTVDFICAQSGLAQRISARKMFGEYALYVDGKVTALVCDDTLFVKPTPQGAALLGAVDLQPPYPGAKPHFCITEQLDDRELLNTLFLATAAALPLPKVKTSAKPKATTPATATQPATKAVAKTSAKKSATKKSSGTRATPPSKKR